MNTLLAALALFATVNIEEVFSKKEAWEETAADFTVDHVGDGFTFASQKRDIVNSLKRGSAVWMGREVWETRLYYGAPESGPRQIEMSLYNNGDRRPGDSCTKDEIVKLIANIHDKYYGKGEKLPKIERVKLKSGGNRCECEWTRCDPTVKVVFGVDDDEASIQFVRVILQPKQKEKPKGATKAVSGQAAAAKVKANVKKNAEGDVWIDGVPMVDQGKKGYCAAAVAERILRYYGHDIDEHEIAQQAGSRAEGGTRVSDMIEVVRNVGVKNRLGFNQIVTMTGSFNDIKNDVDQYNKAAKSMKEPEISLADHTHGNTIKINGIYEEMKPKVLKKMRTKDFRYKKFLSAVKTQVDKGVPICWGVTLGMFPEPGVNIQGRGGHMRLIIGYNTKTREILYTDTWGAGHELKRIPEDWAFTITHDAFFLRPL